MAGDEEWEARFEARGLKDWHVRGSQAHTTYSCGSFTAAGEVAAIIARVCDEKNHHAEIDLRYPDQVRVTTWSHDVGGLSQRDLDLARAITVAMERPQY
ncbi:MAG TPA: 4a-hydroxytetrahydrobiopterin dehydratase [Marmoricola sp.]|nr:4a-hydroxytetrahydrobiopterin dehydratase [Marmoricola sp.]